jgi:hypothetical protein
LDKYKELSFFRKGQNGVMFIMSAPGNKDKIYLSLSHHSDALGHYDFHNRIKMSIDICEAGGMLDTLLARNDKIKFEAFHTFEKENVKTTTRASLVYNGDYTFTFYIKQSKGNENNEAFFKLNQAECAVIRTVLQHDIPIMRGIQEDLPGQS